MPGPAGPAATDSRVEPSLPTAARPDSAIHVRDRRLPPPDPAPIDSTAEEPRQPAATARRRRPWRRRRRSEVAPSHAPMWITGRYRPAPAERRRQRPPPVGPPAVAAARRSPAGRHPSPASCPGPINSDRPPCETSGGERRDPMAGSGGGSTPTRRSPARSSARGPNSPYGIRTRRPEASPPPSLRGQTAPKPRPRKPAARKSSPTSRRTC